jgi:hypothetical protein
MANNASNYLESGILNHIFRAGSFAKPTTWLALTATVPVETDNGPTITEIPHTVGNGYFRVPITGDNMWSQVFQDDGGSGAITNLQVIQFNANASADWGWVSGVAILDNSGDAAGNMLFYGPLTTPKLISIPDTFSIPTGNAIFRLG